MKRFQARFVIFFLLLNVFPHFDTVRAAGVSSGAVVINEIAWMGTTASSSDEWIELFNTTGSSIDLSGWYIEDDDGAQVYNLGGLIAANSYFFIEDSEEATSVVADFIVGFSLTNAGDKLVLKNADGAVIDTVNGSGGEWYAGDNDGKKTMERIDPLVSGDSASNWSVNVRDNGALDSALNTVNGTPDSINSVLSLGDENASRVFFQISDATPMEGDTVLLTAYAEDVADLFSYGFDIIYDPNIFNFIGASAGGFLNENATVETVFEAGLENGVSGKLVVAEARTLEEKIGVDGSGGLFALTFQVVGGEGTTTSVSVGGRSFLADTENDLIADFEDAEFSITLSIISPVKNLEAFESADRYEIALSWNAPDDGADSYTVFRENTAGSYEEIGVTSNVYFIDNDELSRGGNIVPDFDYEYAVSAVHGGRTSELMTVIQSESRGIRGDNNRSDRVDGRDLENLARHFAETLENAGFDPLIDTTYDGSIDGSDLIDIGVNWALTYS